MASFIGVEPRCPLRGKSQARTPGLLEIFPSKLIPRIGEMADVGGESEAALRTALEAYRMNLSNLDANDASYTEIEELQQLAHESATKLAAVLRNEGKLDEAEQLCRELVQAAREQKGDTHRTTLSAITNLGSLLNVLGNSTEAVGLLQEALSGYREHEGIEAEVNLVQRELEKTDVETKPSTTPVKGVSAVGESVLGTVFVSRHT